MDAARDRRRGDATVRVAPGQNATVDITLASNAVVVGKVVDGAGNALPNVPVVVTPDSGDGRTTVSLSGMPPTSGADGTFRIETKPGPAIVVLLVEPKPVSKRGVVLEAGKTTDVGTLVATDSRR